MVGFGSDTATLFVGPSAGPGTWGQIGIGTVQPRAQLSLGELDAGSAGPQNGPQLLLSGKFNEGANRGDGGVAHKLMIEGYDNDETVVYPIFALDEDGLVDFWIKNRPSPVDVPQMFFDGNVGIGTTWPSHQVHIVTSNGTQNALRLEGQGNNGSGAKLSFGDADWVYIQEDGEDSMTIQVQNRLALMAGSVGIGTADPGSYKLAVEGRIGAREIEVKQGSWADFVFDEDYELPSLKEVENFISRNKHLPGIPSEKEVLANGINLGNMDALLLQKIEELTLYIIELEKEMTELKRRYK